VVPVTRNEAEDIVAFVELREGAASGEKELAAYVAERLAPYKHPSEFVIVESLPLTPAGKILKGALRDQFERHKARPAA
jgi:acyl-CoA synthetase (AMP-forming)/AMP-acid ligase II